MNYQIISNNIITDVNITSNTIEVITNPNIIEVAGSIIPIQGNPGEIVPLTFTFPLPLFQWDINHNRGYIPNVIITDVFGYRYYPNLKDIDENSLEVHFDIAFSGIATII